MTGLCDAVGSLIVWYVTGIDDLLIRYWPRYCARRYWQDWDNYRVAGDHVWNKNLLEVLNVQYGYDTPTGAKGE